MVTINGKNVNADGMTVSEYLAEAGYEPLTVAVELNEEILPRDSFADTVLSDGDIVEVVRFMGGGCAVYAHK